MIPAQTAASVSAAAALATALPVELSAADRARVDKALRASRAANTRAQYRSAWRGWAEWSALNGHATLPADPLAIAAYLAERVADGAAVRTIRAAIRAGHVDTGADDPTGHESLACDDDDDEEAPRRARHRGGSAGRAERRSPVGVYNVGLTRRTRPDVDEPNCAVDCSLRCADGGR